MDQASTHIGRIQWKSRGKINAYYFKMLLSIMQESDDQMGFTDAEEEASQNAQLV